MRRFVCAIVVALFLSQSSGAAMAAQPLPSVNATPLLAQVQFDLGQIVASLQTTQMGAFMTGTLSRYDAMHAPPPDFTRARAVRAAAPPDLHPPHATPLFRTGMLIKPPGMAPLFSTSPQSARRDPLALPAHGRSPFLRRAMSVGAVNGSGTTGVNRWWTYEEGALPGVGKWMNNLATGNVLVQEDDVDVPERGIDLAFALTYNSLSTHDAQNTDGSGPDIYGSGWTSTADAHISYNAATSVMTVWDIDGARYDYTSDGQGHWIAPPGMAGYVLAWDGGCGYSWSKKSGTIYGFYSPTYSTCEGAQYAAYNGRAYAIVARNHTNSVWLNYYWSGDASTISHLSQIVMQHSDGQSLTLTFGSFNGYTELASVTRPDGVQVTYQYDTQGDLQGVFEPTNNSGYGYHQYQWIAGQAHQLLNIVSPVYAQNGGRAGSFTTFGYTSGLLTSVALTGWGNFTPNDGTGTALQPSLPQGALRLHASYFCYGMQCPSNQNPSPNETQFGDTDGHAGTWQYDTLGRVTQTQEWTGAPNNMWLTTTAAYDLNNNDLTQTTDARGNATNYTYDANGNVVAMALPMVTTNVGTFRPTSLYSYDVYGGADLNNITAYCDPVRTHNLSLDWTGNGPAPGTTTLCPGTQGSTIYSWDHSDPNEPYGRLSDTYTPLGYHTHFTYDPNSQAGVDAGLPTQVQGDSITQIDGTVRTPTQSFTYDGHGNLTTYNKGNGAWSLSYDSLNRRLAATDPDGVSSYTCYYANGQTEYTESAAQHAMGGSSGCSPSAPAYAAAFGYDADGNVISETHHHMCVTGQPCTPGVTTKWYDGADRLVEVQMPQAGMPWLTRYLYDLSQGDGVGFTDTTGTHSFQAHGGLFETQKYVAPGPYPTSASPQWLPVTASAYDALDRATTQYSYTPTGQLIQTNRTYDTGGNSGLLVTSKSGVSDTTTFSYDSDGQTSTIQFTQAVIPGTTNTYSGYTPNRSYVYDPDGREVSLQTATRGAQTYAYDADGRKISETEANGGTDATFTSPAVFTYGYYADGTNASLSLSSSALSQQNLLQYSYRSDGQMDTTAFNYAGTDYKFTAQYTSAGRLLSRSDPYVMSAVTSSYDAYGRLASYAIPEGSFTGFQYDAESNVVQDNEVGTTTPYAYTQTGQLSKTGLTTYAFVDGYEIPPSNRQPAVCKPWGPKGMYSACYSATPNYDLRDGAPTGYTYTFDSGSSTQPPTGDYQVPPPPNGVTYTYDADGRYTNGHQYDVENHITSSFNGTYGAGYVWGPNGHPVNDENNYSSTNNTHTQHWAGNEIIFSTNAYGQLENIKVPGLAEIFPLDQTNRALQVIDRNYRGQSVGDHNSTGNSGYQAPTVDLYCSNGTLNGNQTSGYVQASDLNPTGCNPVTGLFFQARLDGYFDGIEQIQGVRSYDPSVGIWTTPDAYGGTVSDPATQLKYLWNGGNALAYSDPSGYDISASALALDQSLFPSDESFGDMAGSTGADDTLNSLSQSSSLSATTNPGTTSVAQVTPEEDQDPEGETGNEDNPLEIRNVDGSDQWDQGATGVQTKFAAHGSEFGDGTELEYTMRARTLWTEASDPKNSSRFMVKVGAGYKKDMPATLIYDKESFAFGIYTDTGRIINLYRIDPQSGAERITNNSGYFVPVVPPLLTGN